MAGKQRRWQKKRETLDDGRPRNAAPPLGAGLRRDHRAAHRDPQRHSRAGLRDCPDRSAQHRLTTDLTVDYWAVGDQDEQPGGRPTRGFCCQHVSSDSFSSNIGLHLGKTDSCLKSSQNILVVTQLSWARRMHWVIKHSSVHSNVCVSRD